MQKELGLFPLNLVVFPGEQLNLHIFEPRYKQLIKDCLEDNTTFGIPSYVLNKIEIGTEVNVLEITKTYDDGRMDIKTEGLSVFKVMDFYNPWKDKLYGGGIVKEEYFEDREDADIKTRLIDLIQDLFTWLKMEEMVHFDRSSSIYDIIHKIGLKPEEEYDLLTMHTEVERQNYIVEHLKKILPALERAEKAKERIQMNGHFKHLDPLKF